MASALAVLMLAGCGQQYRPVVSAINPVGPAGQPTKYAVAVSSPGTGLAGLVTFVDVSGDTVLSTPRIVSGPTYFTTSASGAEGYVVNAFGSFNNFTLSNPTTLITSNIGQSTLASGAGAVSISAFTLNGSSATVFVPELNLSRVAALQSAGSISLAQELPVAANPVFVVGADGTRRAYAISQGATGGIGKVAAIEGSPLSVSKTIPVGITPVYGVMTPDANRAFILNKGSGTVSVINVPNNTLDANMPQIPATGTLGVNPIWADLSPRTNAVAGTQELAVLSAGDGVAPGTLSVISIPLCNASAQPTNPNCSSSNPVDAVGFGTVLGSIPVGLNPTMVSILQDGTRAYVVNQVDYDPLGIHHCGAGEGSVSIINMQTLRVTATICAVSTPAGTLDANASPALVYGHPNTVATTTGQPTGKVYITSSDSRFMTVLRTDTDEVQAHISLQGLGVALPTPPASGTTVPVLPQTPGVLVTAP